jgi:predicted nucleotidyltransferase
MVNTLTSQSNTMTLEQVIAHLTQSQRVEAIALFGSTSRSGNDSASDYDLLIVVSKAPVRIFEMQTYIDGRIADVVFIETEVTDRVLALDHPVMPTSDEGFLIGWMEQAQVVYETSAAWLSRIQAKLLEHDWRLLASERELYHDWFWLNFDLRHIKRMAASENPVYQTAADLHLMTNLAELCKVYYRMHRIHWRGAKAAVRYLQQHDAAYLTLLRQCMAETDRAQRIVLFERLVEITLESVGGLWPVGTAGVYLKNPTEQPQRIPDALAFWENLVGTPVDNKTE